MANGLIARISLFTTRFFEEVVLAFVDAKTIVALVFHVVLVFQVDATIEELGEMALGYFP